MLKLFVITLFKLASLLGPSTARLLKTNFPSSSVESLLGGAVFLLTLWVTELNSDGNNHRLSLFHLTKQRPFFSFLSAVEKQIGGVSCWELKVPHSTVIGCLYLIRSHLINSKIHGEDFLATMQPFSLRFFLSFP